MSVEPLMAWKYEDRAKVIGQLRTRSDATSGWPALVGSGMTESLLVEHGSYNGVFPASISRSRSRGLALVQMRTVVQLMRWQGESRLDSAWDELMASETTVALEAM